jgi:curved DNA-binding protein CbpA
MASREHRDPYVVLGVRRQASPDEIARAYRRAARATHPDSSAAGSGERFQAVSDAYHVLRDPGRRADYDRLHPLARPQTARATRSARYAAPGSQHVVLRTRRPSARSQLRAGDVHVFLSVRGAVRGVLRVALSLLRGSS